ncbi:MAG: 2Fe-2S iron-sulfur cluster-binding protein, partial [Steroidobacteraceae bacterium]
MPRITLVPTGQTFDSEPRESLLSAALRAGLNQPHSCRGGHCGSCRARLITGQVAYRTPGLPAGLAAEEAAVRYVLLCQAHALTEVQVETREIRAAPDAEVRSLPCRIERMTRLAEDVMAVFLRLPAVEHLHFRAGQYVDFVLSGGRRRSFSIASAPADGRTLEVHVRRASASGFTAQLFDTLQPGALLRLEGPLGQFWFREDSPRTPLMIGGGTGYAPLRSMLRQMLAVDDRRPLILYWG